MPISSLEPRTTASSGMFLPGPGGPSGHPHGSWFLPGRDAVAAEHPTMKWTDFKETLSGAGRRGRRPLLTDRQSPLLPPHPLIRYRPGRDGPPSHRRLRPALREPRHGREPPRPGRPHRVRRVAGSSVCRAAGILRRVRHAGRENGRLRPAGGVARRARPRSPPTRAPPPLVFAPFDRSSPSSNPRPGGSSASLRARWVRPILVRRLGLHRPAARPPPLSRARAVQLAVLHRACAAAEYLALPQKMGGAGWATAEGCRRPPTPPGTSPAPAPPAQRNGARPPSHVGGLRASDAVGLWGLPLGGLGVRTAPLRTPATLPGHHNGQWVFLESDTTFGVEQTPCGHVAGSSGPVRCVAAEKWAKSETPS
ncbi:hypothetical protein DFJ74DRAFT_91695 [Hyaloraphidium curvatum]|nr:hypothetical protein DFJ74DRAFT_91695 [Hyaloraphidium curvatum]